MSSSLHFGPWRPLALAVLDEAPAAPGAIQVRREEGLVDYPSGKSAMVFYAFAASGVRAAVERAFADELRRPGARGQGPLLVRWCVSDDAQAGLEGLLEGFVLRFGAPPVLHTS